MAQNNIATLQLAVAAWDYDKAVERARPKVADWHQFTIEVCRELYIAREALRQWGGDRRNALNTSSIPHTWGDFCADIGLTRGTANRWLALFVPRELSGGSEDTLGLEAPAGRASREDARLAIVSHIALYRETGRRPDGWTNDDEAELRRQEAEARATDMAMDALPSLRKYEMKYAPKMDYFAEMLSRARDVKIFNLTSKPLRRAQAEAFDAVTRYLYSIPDLDDRAKAAANLSYKLRMVVNDTMEQHRILSGEAETVEHEVVQ
jgi:hypothetical protein